jgi:hypothetical protein
MKFILTAKLGNDAMQEHDHSGEATGEPSRDAISDMLRTLAGEIDSSDAQAGIIRDYNGNDIGTWAMSG